eukprot:1940501-Pyramimonas_sp.AAC.1
MPLNPPIGPRSLAARTAPIESTPTWVPQLRGQLMMAPCLGSARPPLEEAILALLPWLSKKLQPSAARGPPRVAIATRPWASEALLASEIHTPAHHGAAPLMPPLEQPVVCRLCREKAGPSGQKETEL